MNVFVPMRELPKYTLTNDNKFELVLKFKNVVYIITIIYDKDKIIKNTFVTLWNSEVETEYFSCDLGLYILFMIIHINLPLEKQNTLINKYGNTPFFERKGRSFLLTFEGLFIRDMKIDI